MIDLSPSQLNLCFFSKVSFWGLNFFFRVPFSFLLDSKFLEDVVLLARMQELFLMKTCLVMYLRISICFALHQYLRSDIHLEFVPRSNFLMNIQTHIFKSRRLLYLSSRKLERLNYFLINAFASDSALVYISQLYLCLVSVISVCFYFHVLYMSPKTWN